MTRTPPHTELPATHTVRLRTSRRRAWLTPLVFLLLLSPTTSATQPKRGCPRLARVPGYGACTNIAGSSCLFCAYRCNDDTVVRWNVCGG